MDRRMQTGMNGNRQCDVIPLNRAYLCADCDCISSGAAACRACGSRSILALAWVLGEQERLEDRTGPAQEMETALEREQRWRAELAEAMRGRQS